ncbi:MAG: amino acid permease [Lachnospiraceae bacterium]|nr:amino acid permease [Lachnospiraceae bacterium]
MTNTADIDHYAKQKQTIDSGRYLSPLAVWALSFGCAVGWGAFVMPGTTFLPAAGPLGTALGILIGAVVMFIIGTNYHYLMNKYPDAGGTLTYTIKTFGYDHGFMSAWFLILVYVAIIWANASALGLISKNLLGTLFQFGFHYQILGYEVFFGEVLLSVAAIVICGSICMYGKRVAAASQILFAMVLLVGVAVCAIAVFGVDPANAVKVTPAFAENGKLPVLQVFTIVALSPWAFVGFESVSNSSADFRFPAKRVIWILAAALLTGTFCYIALTLMATRIIPDYKNWSEYIENLSSIEGVPGLPTFYAADKAIKGGAVILGVAAFAGIMTGLIGNFIAASRLIYAMTEDGMLPEWFGRLDRGGTSRNAFVFLVGISVFIPFLGRTAIGWIVDVNTVGATIAYAYTSADAFVTARKENDKKILVTGIIGMVMSAVFFLYFMSWSAGAMSTESYLILATWSILGFIYFRVVFSRDQERRFGKSTVVWIGLLFLIFFTSLMWVKQASDEMTQTVVENIRNYYESHSVEIDDVVREDAEQYFTKQLLMADRVLTRNSMIQMALLVASLGIMFSIYTTISRRERQMEVEKISAEESNKAKTAFLSNMSHDIRTPLNAIIGYINIAEREETTLPEMKNYIRKIDSSSHHLLALINDALEMSRIESGKMDLEPIAIDLKKTLEEVEDMFATQMSEKGIDFTVDVSGIRDNCVMCDKNRLNRVLLNLVSNAYKFTPKGGTVSVIAGQTDPAQEGYGIYEIRVADSGIGMSKEFAAKVFEAFERERTSTVSKIQGTGLGMAITKSIVEMMGGTIEVQTARGKGTEFIIRVGLELAKVDDADKSGATQGEQDEKTKVDFGSMRVLLVDDVEINLEIATMQLESLGFTVETASNGEEAVQKVRMAKPGYYNAVLMDIQMPVMNGYEATKTIRAISDKAYSRIPIIAMTADAFSEDVKRAHDAGMNAHIAKPIDVNIMTNVLSDILG